MNVFCRLTMFAVLAAGAAGIVAAPYDELKAGFTNPPAAARPQTWWHWMNGNITPEGITADLEAMKQIGLGGATIVNVDCGVPPGPVKFMSPEWRKDFKFAVQEANRLGLDLCVENCAGWSSSGGPWNTVTNAMQRLTASETNVHGPSSFNAVLPQPPTTLDYYREVAVLAFKAPARGNQTSGPEDSARGKLQIKRAIYESRSGDGSVDVTGRIVERIRRGEKSMPANNTELGCDPAEGQPKQLRLEFVLDDQPETLIVEENETLVFPSSQGQLARARAQHKGTFKQTFVQPTHPTEADISPPIPRNGIVDLTGKLTTDGRLSWEVPPGEWTILRLGHTPIGVKNHPAPKEGEGLECDKLSKAALDAHWDGFMNKILADIQPLAGRSLNCSLIDSYEVGNQDWTENFREEFKRRRGYDPVTFLPTFTHRVVEDPEVTERFLWDLRRTVADLFAENYFAHFATLCRQHGLQSAIEPYGGPFESLQCGAPADVVMGEFWTGTAGHPSVKLAASIAHIYGKTIVGAESFTASEQAGRWQNDPYSLKPLGDLMFCQGLNRVIFHRYAMQPWTNRWPGMTMGKYGLHFERTQTWWSQARPWIEYLTRCQYLLQQGHSVADVAYFTGERAPAGMRANNSALPEGYDYDAVNADLLLHGAQVKAGRLVLASGASYAALVLPPGDVSMTPELLKGLTELVRAGATVVGQPPGKAPGLRGYPESDKEVRRLVREVWGPCDGTTVKENPFGRGRVFWGKPLGEVLTSLNMKPDFEVAASPTRPHLAYAHRSDGAQDIYFVSNQREQFESVECVFRVTGKIPELWHPDSGVTERAQIWSTQNGRTTVRLNFDPAGSVFVIFREQARAVESITSFGGDIEGPKTGADQPPKLEITRAIYAAVDDTQARDVTANVAEMVKAGRLSIPVSNNSLGGDPATNRLKELRVEFVTDGEPGTLSAREGAVLTLLQPPTNRSPLDYEIGSTDDGALFVRAWRNGHYTFATSSGKKLEAEVSDLPTPQHIGAPWNVSFESGRGAPKAASFDKLISWTAHTNTGVRYFSGAATYEQDVDVSPGLLAVGRELWLDLGTVKNIAEVFLNGQNLGVLWKPPFRVNITSAAKAGINKLVVKVTNLWPNRLIGDEQLPADCEWDGHRLKAWPPWLLAGKPSPTGRITFATWKYYSKDSPLLESGLLGPVTLNAVTIRNLAEAYVNPTRWLGSWIWDKHISDGQTCQFWRSFQIPDGVNVTKARVAMSADDEFTLYLDGRELGRGADWRELYDFDFLAPLLPPGRHILAVKAFNSFHSAGMILGMHIELSDGRGIDLKSDEDWRVVPERVKNFSRMTEAAASWPMAEIKAPLGGNPWQPFPVSVDKMPALQPLRIFFWQTGWFQITLATVCGLAIVYSLRLMAQLALHRQERHLLQQERARIAREIHDDIGARMTQLVLHGEVAQYELANTTEIREQLVQLCDEARSLLSTMDEILWAVNPQRDAVKDFSSFVCNYAQEFLKHTPIQCLFEIDGEIPETVLDLPIRRSLLMAIKEALNNAVKYSGATELRLKIQKPGPVLVVSVEDNGRGFDLAAVKPGRNGLANMKQRMEQIGGTCSIVTRPGEGCRLKFCVQLRRSSWRIWRRNFFAVK